MILERYRALIAEELAKAANLDGLLGILVRYPLGLCQADGSPGPGIGGKLLRPTLVLFSCEALAGKAEQTLPLALALELVHNFSLVHDDIQDEDELRRGRATAWKVFGVGQAINAGDALLVLAFRTALQAALPENLRLLAQKTLVSATMRMIEGQVLDLASEGRSLSVKDYLAMARRKTGALLGCAFGLGAIAAKRPELAETSANLGEELGLAFQIKDDILGIWGDPTKTGKPVAADLFRRKRSFPVCFALAEAPELAELLAEPKKNLNQILGRLGEIGAREAAEEALAGHLRTTQTWAQKLPWPAWAKQAFAELLEFLAEREA